MLNYNFRNLFILMFFAVAVFIGQAMVIYGQIDSIKGDRSGKSEKITKSVQSPQGEGFILGLPTLYKTLPSTFAVPVTVTDVNASNPIFSYQFNVLYDPAIIQPVGANAGCDISGTIGMFVFCNVAPAGVLRVSTTGFGSISGTGTLLNVNFATTGTAQISNVSPLTFSDDLFFNSVGAQIARINENGSVTVVGPTSAEVSVGGRVLSSSGRSIRGATVSVADAEGNTKTAITNIFGYYTIEGLPTGRSYVVTTRAKGYEFAPEVLDLTEILSSFNIFAEN